VCWLLGLGLGGGSSGPSIHFVLHLSDRQGSYFLEVAQIGHCVSFQHGGWIQGHVRLLHRGRLALQHPKRTLPLTQSCSTSPRRQRGCGSANQEPGASYVHQAHWCAIPLHPTMCQEATSQRSPRVHQRHVGGHANKAASPGTTWGSSQSLWSSLMSPWFLLCIFFFFFFCFPYSSSLIFYFILLCLFPFFSFLSSFFSIPGCQQGGVLDLCACASLPVMFIFFLCHSVWHPHWHLPSPASDVEGLSSSFHSHLNVRPR
jgi:hypothetical protein